MCPAPERLAAAVSGEDADALAHAGTCARCAELVAEQRELLALVTGMRVTPLRLSRRDELAAEVMARADALPARRGRRWLAVAGGAAVAAAVALVLATRPRDAQAPMIVVAAPGVDTAPIGERAVARQVAPPPVAVEPLPELVKLSDGEVSIDATGREPVTVIAGDTSIVIRSRAKIVARGGVIMTAHVFAGTAEIVRGGETQIIEAGELWTRPASSISLDAFRAGWEALRADDYAKAIAAFDRATDEVIAEDAAFWAAIASERAGDRAEAARRLEAFIEQFPASASIGAARSALERVTP